MKILKTLFAGAVFAAFPFSVFAFGIDDIQKFSNSNDFASTIDSGLNDFADNLASSIPQAATQQNVWSDAWIGKFFPSVPPHFGGGLNIAATHIDTSGLAKAADALGIGGIKDSYYFPCFTVDLRIGGIFLPFDLGIAVMKTGTLSTDAMGCDLSVDFLTIGMDARYCIFEGGLLLPKVSVGGGYFYNSGTFGASESHAEATIDYKVHTLYGQVQVSKQILILTPFVGLRALVSKYENNYDWKIKDSSVVSAANSLGFTTSGNGSVSSSSFDFGGIQPQIFAGVSLNLFFLQATLSISADLRHITDDGLWSGAFSLRAKL